MSREKSEKHKNAIDKLFADIRDDNRLNLKNCSDNNTFYVDVFVDSNAYHIQADLPGFEINDINVEYIQNYLEISASRTREKDSDGKKLIRAERCFGRVKRSFFIENIDENSIKANISMGVLHIIIPFSTE